MILEVSTMYNTHIEQTYAYARMLKCDTVSFDCIVKQKEYVQLCIVYSLIDEKKKKYMASCC